MPLQWNPSWLRGVWAHPGEGPETNQPESQRRRGFPDGTSERTHLPKQETWETQVRSPGQEDPLEEGMATHSSILAWRIPWTEEPGGLQSMGSQRVGHIWSDDSARRRFLLLERILTSQRLNSSNSHAEFTHGYFHMYSAFLIHNILSSMPSVFLSDSPFRVD